MNAPTRKAQNINAFFENYMNALEKHDTKAMAYMYHVPCTMLSDDTTTFFNEHSKLEGLFNQGLSFYRQFGVIHVHADVWNRQYLSERVVRVKVNWQYLDAARKPLYNCDYQYVMKLDKHEQWKIILSISVNEKERMEEAQRKGVIAQ